MASFLKNPAALKAAAAVNALENSSVHQVTAKLVKLMEIDGVGQCMCRDEAHTLQLKQNKFDLWRSLEDCRRCVEPAV